MARILVVDDEPSIRMLIRTILQGEGHQITTAANGREALEMVIENVPELIVLDLMMPEMDGVEVLRAIRGDPAIAHTSVVFNSAGFDLAKREEALALGAVAWLLKGGEAGDFTHSLRTITDWYERVGFAVAGHAVGQFQTTPLNAHGVGLQKIL